MADPKADKDEIEITPEMIEAGVEKLFEFDIQQPFRAEMRDAVAAVFREMLRHRH